MDDRRPIVKPTKTMVGSQSKAEMVQTSKFVLDLEKVTAFHKKKKGKSR